MVNFNEFRITSDGRTLVIDVSIINHPYCEDVYIDKIQIDNQDTYIGTGPSEEPVYEYIISKDSN